MTTINIGPGSLWHQYSSLFIPNWHCLVSTNGNAVLYKVKVLHFQEQWFSTQFTVNHGIIYWPIYTPCRSHLSIACLRTGKDTVLMNNIHGEKSSHFLNKYASLFSFHCTTYLDPWIKSSAQVDHGVKHFRNTRPRVLLLCYYCIIIYPYYPCPSYIPVPLWRGFQYVKGLTGFGRTLGSSKSRLSSVLLP